MKKAFLLLMLFLCVGSLFGQSLFDVVRRGTPIIIQEAIDAGAKVDEIDKDGCTPLMLAAIWNDNPDVITTLVKAGAKLDDRNNKDGANKGMTPLMYAAELCRNPEVIKALAIAGAEIDAGDADGYTPLIYAAWFNENLDVIIALLNAGATINQPNRFGATPLMYAAQRNTNPDIIIALLNAGAEINKASVVNKTALMYAAEKNTNPDIIIKLLEAGADVSLKNYQGQTALAFAEGNPKIKGTSAYFALKNGLPTSPSIPVATQTSGGSWTETPFGAYKVERKWEESTYTYILVSYRNTTNRTFSSMVTLTAILYDANNQMLDLDDRSLFVSDSGPISPGFEGTVKISVSVIGSKRVEIRIEGH